MFTIRLGASRGEIAAEAGRTEAAYLRAMKQVDELSTLAQVTMHFSVLRNTRANVTSIDFQGHPRQSQETMGNI